MSATYPMRTALAVTVTLLLVALLPLLLLPEAAWCAAGRARARRWARGLVRNYRSN